MTPAHDGSVFLVRHGRTGLNAAGGLRGHIDVDLDDVGRAEVAALGDYFRGIAIAAVVTSPLTRARDTAAAIAAATGAPQHVEPALIDRDYGEWAGHTRAEVEARFGSLDGAPGVEPLDVVAARAVGCIERLLTGGATPLVVVADDAVNRAVLNRLVPSLGAPDQIPQRTGCWNQLDRHSGNWPRRSWTPFRDDTRHASSRFAGRAP